MNGPSASDRCQRWLDMQATWVDAGRDHFDPDQYTVGPLDEDQAAAFVKRHHYSGSYPAAVYRYGLWRDQHLVGVAVLSNPVQAAVLTNVFPELRPYAEALELGRFVLLDPEPGNTESWFLARVFEQAQAAGVAGVVSFSDPQPRQTSSGVLVAGHVGTIYQATNALYLGRATPRYLTLLPDGTVLNDRAAQKIRRQEKGSRYGEQLLVDHGAQPMAHGDDPARWLQQALAQIGARRQFHRGNHRYAFTLGRSRRERAQVRVAMDPVPYPKRPDGLQGHLL